MVTGSSTPDVPVLVAIRRLLIATLFAGIVGTGVELVARTLRVLESDRAARAARLRRDGGRVAVAAPRAASVRALQAVAILFLAAGVFGVGLHHDGNSAFELEMYPSPSGLELVRKTLTGATPVLAPGSMVVLGLIGLAYTHRHPEVDQPQWFYTEDMP
jgi:hypothetical protein